MRYRLALLSILLTLPGCGARSASIAPAKDTLYTSTRYVRSIAAAPDGTIWVATRGGVLRRAPDGAWTKFTQLDGLPSNEAISVAIDGNKVNVTSPTADAVLKNGKWTFKPAHNESYMPDPAVPVSFRGKQYRAETNGWGVGVLQSGKWHEVAQFNCSSELFVKGDQLWVATYHDGIQAFDGKSWKRADIEMPGGVDEITAMLMAGSSIWIGVGEDGLWQYDGKSWKQHLQPDEPFSSECATLAMHSGQLFAGTLNDGLVIRSADGWQSIRTPRGSRTGVLSSNYPKSMAEFGGNLYVLQNYGAVDRFDGDKWEKNVFSMLPRGSNVSLLVSDGKRIYAGQWGGWSEFDGKTWSHRLRNPSMQGHQVTCLLPDGDTLWVGLQGLGLAQVDESTGDITWNDERKGLSDDWVTRLCKVGDRLYAGTFYGGLAYYEDGKWTVLTKLKTQRINDIVPDGKGGVLVAAVSGVWRFANGEMTRLFPNPNSPDREANSLCIADGGLWIGTRTGIYYAAGRP